jgi:hypothetical protein
VPGKTVLFRAFYGLRLPIRGVGIFPKETDVNIPGKYRFNPLFRETERFNLDLTCENSGAVRVAFFSSVVWYAGMKGRGFCGVFLKWAFWETGCFARRSGYKTSFWHDPRITRWIGNFSNYPGMAWRVYPGENRIFCEVMTAGPGFFLKCFPESGSFFSKKILDSALQYPGRILS